MPTRNFTTGFTIIELLVVILIVGVLATVVLGSFSTSRIKARNAQRMSDLTQIQLALEQYYDDFGEYPECPTSTRSSLICVSFGNITAGGGGLLAGSFQNLVIKPAYIPVIPLDPSTNSITQQYVYIKGYRKIGNATWKCITGTNETPCLDSSPLGYSGTEAGDPKREYILFGRLETFSGGPTYTVFNVGSNLLAFNVLLGNEY